MPGIDHVISGPNERPWKNCIQQTNTHTDGHRNSMTESAKWDRFSENYTWHVTCDMWHVTRDMWHMKSDMWHVTSDTWHVTHGGRWTFSQNVWSLALMVWDLLIFEGREEKNESLNELISDKGVSRTVPAKPGLFTISYHIFFFVYNY